jgi:hypothetical protein
MVSNYVMCTKCGEWHFNKCVGTFGSVLTLQCSCKSYRVSVYEWDLSYEWKDGSPVQGSEYLEFYEIHSKDPGDAARQFVENREQLNSDYKVGSGEEEVHVIIYDSDDRVRVYAVHGEVIPTYYETGV